MHIVYVVRLVFMSIIYDFDGPCRQALILKTCAQLADVAYLRVALNAQHTTDHKVYVLTPRRRGLKVHGMLLKDDEVSGLAINEPVNITKRADTPTADSALYLVVHDDLAPDAHSWQPILLATR